MGICFGKTASTSGVPSYTPSSATAPARQTQPSPPARNSEEGVLSGLPRRGQQAGPSHHVVETDSYRNVVDFSPKVERQTIREPGESLRTSALTLCTGVAVGGVRRDDDGSVAASSVSIFHVLPGVPSPGVAIARKVGVLRAAGFEVNAVIAGGDHTTQTGLNVRAALEGMLEGMSVPLTKGPMSDGFKSHFISATIEHNGEIDYNLYSGH
jgi:hypothetical protein